MRILSMAPIAATLLVLAIVAVLAVRVIAFVTFGGGIETGLGL